MSSSDPHTTGRYNLLAALITVLGTLGAVYLAHYLNRETPEHVASPVLSELGDLSHHDSDTIEAIPGDRMENQGEERSSTGLYIPDIPAPDLYAKPYIVLAGSYRQQANAASQVDQLKRLGYSHARVEILGEGNYAVVFVDDFDSAIAARECVRELSQQGVDSFIKRRDD